MEPSSWPVHFRNHWRPPAGLALAAHSGEHSSSQSRRFIFVGGYVEPRVGIRCVGVAGKPVLSADLRMRHQFLIRTCWSVALCGVLALAIRASADTTPQSRTTSKKKPVHHSAGTAEAPASNSSASKVSTHKAKHVRSKAKSKSRKRGQQAIDSERAQQIQEALIREHYLQGKASGKWDATTQAAMQHYQADQGWQTKTIPDSRALIKLGLGPSAEHLLNPDSAMTSSIVPASTKTDSKSNADDPPASPSEQSPSGDPPQQ